MEYFILILADNIISIMIGGFRYNACGQKSLEEIIDFHHGFELIHPFQDGNGHVGRLIIFKECLNHNVAFFIDGEFKLF